VRYLSVIFVERKCGGLGSDAEGADVALVRGFDPASHRGREGIRVACCVKAQSYARGYECRSAADRVCIHACTC
jgi:hypothetical protein